MRRRTLVLFPLLTAFWSCATALQPLPDAWLNVPRAPRIRSVVLSDDGKAAPSSQPALPTLPKGTIHAANGAIVNGGKTLAGPFAALDSFDLSQSRGEVVFSIRREGESDFDIGLVAVEGSEISWIPDDPADEVAVEWAPKGSKISYVVRARFGDVVRTLHIPTAFSFGVDFPFSRVEDIGWDPAGERYAVVWSSPTSSDAVDVLRYSGEARRVAVEPAARVAAAIEPFAGDAILLRPEDIRYGETLPLVIWRGDDRLSWNDARAELLRTARVALVITSREPDAALLARARETAYVDATRVFTVNCTIDGATAILGDTAVPTGRYRQHGRFVSVPPAVVESVAARFIADQLKRTSPPNGR